MHENVVRIKAVANLLRDLNQPFVFVGGATVSLYATEPDIAAGIRPTEDVDVVVELATYKGYAEIDERLRSLGFVNDAASRVICRYRINGLIVDVMPTEDKVLGFSNRWYPAGFKAAVSHTLDEEMVIRIFSVPYFLASKWDAHKARGGNDLRLSKDFEDIVYVWQHCKDFDVQLSGGPKEILEYFHSEFAGKIDHDDFEEAVYAHLDPARYGANPRKIILALKGVLRL